MNIHFKLRKQGMRNPTIVMHVFDRRFKARKFMYSTGISLDEVLWDKRRGRPKVSPGSLHETQLLSIEATIVNLEKTTLDFLSTRYGQTRIERKDLKDHLIKAVFGDQPNIRKEPSKPGFVETWRHIIENTKNQSGIPLTAGTKRSKLQTLRLLEEYSRCKQVELDFLTIDMNFYHSLDAFMREKNLGASSRGKHFKEIKAILREASDRDIPVNTSYQKKSFKVVRLRPDNIYLKESEIRNIFELKLTPAQTRQRDIFVMACYTGLRHSDWHQIRKENIVNEKGTGMLRVRQTKTGEVVHIPIHPAVKMILDKYEGNPPTVIANQKFNEVLKTIGKQADLGNVMIEGQLVGKWELVSTHTARRSFATNAYLSRALDVYQIMKFTGHRSESSFLRYLKLDGKDFAIQAAESTFFNDQTWQTMKIAS